MKKSLILIMTLFFVSANLQSQLTKEEKKQQKREIDEKEYLATKELVNSSAFTFVALQTSPLGGPTVFLNTTPNYINIDGEQADIYLPYFGVVHAANGYNAEAGIKFNGKLENYEIKFNDKKLQILLTFEIQRGHERHEFNFNIFKGATASLVVASSRRNSISYNGLISELELPLTN
ncbi:MAG: DUF4251 domain-containing protein [Flavobacteriaceae bacterium]